MYSEQELLLVRYCLILLLIYIVHLAKFTQLEVCKNYNKLINAVKVIKIQT